MWSPALVREAERLGITLRIPQPKKRRTEDEPRHRLPREVIEQLNAPIPSPTRAMFHVARRTVPGVVVSLTDPCARCRLSAFACSCPEGPTSAPQGSRIWSRKSGRYLPASIRTDAALCLEFGSYRRFADFAEAVGMAKERIALVLAVAYAMQDERLEPPEPPLTEMVDDPRLFHRWYDRIYRGGFAPSWAYAQRFRGRKSRSRKPRTPTKAQLRELTRWAEEFYASRRR